MKTKHSKSLGVGLGLRGRETSLLLKEPRVRVLIHKDKDSPEEWLMLSSASSLEETIHRTSSTGYVDQQG